MTPSVTPVAVPVERVPPATVRTILDTIQAALAEEGSPEVLQAWFVGEGSLLVRCAETFRAHGHIVTGVATSDAAVRRWATAEAIPTVPVDEHLTARLAAAPFDYLFSIVNLSRFDRQVIASPRRMAVNFHDGPLPSYAGLNTPVWALLRGERQYGVTWHQMTDAIDAGRILKEQRFEIPEDETSFGLNARCYEAGLQSFGALVDDLTADRLSPVAQASDGRTMFTRYERPADQLVIDWSRPASDIARTVRATDFGPYPNGFGVVRLLTRHGAYVVSALSEQPETPSPGPSVVAAIEDDKLVIGTGEGVVAVTSIRRPTGEAISIRDLAAEAGLRTGERIPAPADPPSGQDMACAVRAEASWIEALGTLHPVAVPYAEGTASLVAGRSQFRGNVPDALVAGDQPGRRRIASAVGAFLVRLAGQAEATLPLAIAAPPPGGVPLLADRVPVRFDLTDSWPLALGAVGRTAEDVVARGSFFVDLCLRHPDRQHLTRYSAWRAGVVLDPDSVVPLDAADAQLVVRVDDDGRAIVWDGASGAWPDATLARLHAHWSAFASAASDQHDGPVESMPLVDPAVRRQLIETWNDTAVAYEPSCVHELIERQAAATPEAVALICGDESVTYRGLETRANRFARYLQAMAIGRDCRVGICLDRSVDMVVALLAVLKAGAAYVPLDPHYPRERLELVSRDAALDAVVAERAHLDAFAGGPPTICMDDERAAIDRHDEASLGRTAHPEDLAYLIYTSGSTGTPKGVMIEHRHVANFLVGMDACVPHEEPGVWLSVTSISFDISVLELFWTLARGFTVVLYQGESGTSLPQTMSTRPEPIDLSLFYFSADEGQEAAGKYRLLIEGAKFADAHGFAAVWTPERHFHAFGGLYPNPAVTGAAVAAITSHVGVRAGSCVLPLHHPFRVAEEWSVVDNISGGRVGIAFASGWQPNDFVLRPESYARRKDVLFEGLETVRALWRGEAVDVTTPRGDVVATRTLPRPIQPELPTWITAAGNPETFAAAARAGAGVLTHLLGQTFEELAVKVAAYRAAWREAGHAGSGHVVLMLHTLVGTDEARVRDLVREPLKAYLRTSIDLVKPFAESFPTFAARSGNPSEIFAALSEEDFEALVDYSFERYYQTSGLFGRPETCLATVDRAKAIGIDEIACLVDFGVATDVVLEHLPHLHTLLDRANGRPPADDSSIAGLMARHTVTHLQCTPSMARMLVGDPIARRALGGLRAMFVGGEALPAGLAADLLAALGVPGSEDPGLQGHAAEGAPAEGAPGLQSRRSTPGSEDPGLPGRDPAQLWNMYGPTETTVWSTVARIAFPVERVTIGRPIANTHIYILDEALQPVPIGIPGDLYIGGDGVARGYWQRPDLTADRFQPDPFRSDGSRMYATGDLARYRDDGSIEFLGRGDQQVKIRGHRIELGEIETAIAELPGVHEVVVIAREDREGDRRLVAYIVGASGAARDGRAVRAALGARLPDFLVPAHVVFLDRLPLTPNNKVDRKALPAPETAGATPESAPALSPGMEETVAAIWRDVLGTDSVGADENFFDIGGDSLLAAQVLGALRARIARPVSLTDLFRYPTVRQLAVHLGTDDRSRTTTASVERARARQAALEQRRTVRSRS